MADNKDTIYVDVDDEITAIIDKVRSSSSKVVALVLPKRASVLQSIVNLKLLKRSADNQKKNLVLITTEAALLPLAGAVGVHVAKTLSSAPEIPPPPISGDSDTETVEEDMNVVPLEEDGETPDLTKGAAAGASVGALADAAKPMPKSDDVLETLKLDDEEEKAKAPLDLKQKILKNKHLKVPNFNRFRVILLLSILAIIGIIVLLILALTVWPHASISIKTDASSVNTSQNLTLDPSATSVDQVNGDIPAKQVSEQKTFTQTVNTTGQKNEGNSASGQVSMSYVECPPFSQPNPIIVPAGTGVSANSLTYITQKDTSLSITGPSGKTCILYQSNAPTPINAQSPGTQYNTPNNTSFSVAGYPGVTATGSASGGTDNLVQIVAQADINTATAKINANNGGTAEADLSNQLKGQGLYPINVTLTAGTPQITSTPNAGDPGSTVTVTEIITYTMFGAKLSDIQSVVDTNIRSQTTKNQNIISDGITETAFKQAGTSGSADQVSLSTLAIVGPNISAVQIKQETKGKSAKEAIAAIKQNPDVTSVTIRLSPFWVSSVPGNLTKITVVIAKPSVTAAH